MAPIMAYEEMQHPYIVQIFGKRPEMFLHAAKVVEELGADGVDINFGCPSKKVVKHGSGVKLMTNLPLVREIVQATCEGAKNIPVSIKIRAGINMKIADQEAMDARYRTVEKMTAEMMVDSIKDLPFQGVMIHGRTYEQGFIGDLDIEQIKAVKRLIGERPCLVNGGITSPEIAKEVLAATGVDGIGIGRGVFGKPWISNQIKEYLSTGSYTEPTWEEKKVYMKKHAERIFKQKGNHGMLEIRKHLAWYIKGMHNASDYRAELMQVQNPDDVNKILDKI